MKNIFVLTSLILVSTYTFAQSPGGLSNLQLWLKADAGLTTTGPGLVSSWVDQSANAETFTPPSTNERPTFQDGSVQSNGTNYNPAVDFYEDGNPDYLVSANVGTNAQTWFFHHLPEGYSDAMVGAGYAINSGLRNKNILRLYPNINTLFSGNNDDIAHNTNGSIFQRSEIWDYSINNRPSISNYERSTVFTPLEPFTIGWSGDTDFPNRKWQGDINEVIIFDTDLTPTQTLKVDSYLAIKYGMTLSNDNDGDGIIFELNTVNEGDYLSTNGDIIWDADLINNGYHNEIIGIGRDDAQALLQKQSHTYDDSTRIYIDALQSTNINNSGSFNSDISYVTMGDNRGKMCATAASVAEMPAGCSLYSRIEREWKVTKTNFSQVYNNDFTLEACALPGSVNPADLRLLVDDDGDFSNGGTSCYYNGDGTGIVISYSNPIITVSNISNTHIADNITRFITIASISPNSPLPVGLKQFDVDCQEENVLLSWSTGSELNNDYFTIERGNNGNDFEIIATIDGAGSSSSSNWYSWVDTNPIRGTSFYRLSQTDFNEKKDVFETRSVNCGEGDLITIYPNPFENKLQIKAIFGGELTLVDNSGKVIMTSIIVAGENSIAVDNLSSGIYLTYFTSEKGTRRINKLIKL